MSRFMVKTNCGGATSVKALEFFLSQGGHDANWGKNWQHVEADSFSEARAVGCVIQNGNPQQIGLSGDLPEVESRTEDGVTIYSVRRDV